MYTKRKQNKQKGRFDMKNIVIITGASSGMGMEFAKQLDKKLKFVDEFWLVARRKERLEKLDFLLHHKCRLFDVDLMKPEDVKRIEEALNGNKQYRIRMLINCAGFGLVGNFMELEKKEQLEMIDLNCKALTEMTYICLPHMDRKSRIIQLGSVSAFLPQQSFAIYAASKSYVLSFSRALNEELKDLDITVTAVCSGPVDTEFFETAEKNGNTMEIKKLFLVQADRVVSDAIFASQMKWSLSLCSVPMVLFIGLTKFLPHGLILKATNLFYK